MSKPYISALPLKWQSSIVKSVPASFVFGVERNMNSKVDEGQGHFSNGATITMRLANSFELSSFEAGWNAGDDRPDCNESQPYPILDLTLHRLIRSSLAYST